MSNDFDAKMNGVMFNDNNTTDTPQTMWWDGTQMSFDAPPARQVTPIDFSRKGQVQSPTPAQINGTGI